MNKYQLSALHKFNEWDQLDYVIIDTETTGLTKSSEILEIAIIDKHGQILVNTFVRPKGRIPKTATDIHGINRAMVKDSPTFPEVWEQQVWPIIKDRKVLIYNADYDTRLMLQSLKKWDVPIHYPFDVDCVMKAYSNFIGSPRWVSLEKACGHKIEHRALSDCYATLEVIQKVLSIAKDEVAAAKAPAKKESKKRNKPINTAAEKKTDPKAKLDKPTPMAPTSSNEVLTSQTLDVTSKPVEATPISEITSEGKPLDQEPQSSHQLQINQKNTKDPFWKRILRILTGNY
ncbi:3'-5' exonuclease [Thermoactinomyces sp. CICC 10521]|uniref:3'-5' exonuclease n=1 Tax=Thermoactinomyces sp. CICC 10521 TaxID=2767426 RepID=UPI0018DE1F54|nr:3'-5' exonuclease [Thermoactinomyces sp. CICC 10521]MBH8606002.1 3'-5' exonuclease [Thermoactinomyces sp. CICC 10521]